MQVDRLHQLSSASVVVARPRRRARRPDVQVLAHAGDEVATGTRERDDARQRLLRREVAHADRQLQVGSDARREAPHAVAERQGAGEVRLVRRQFQRQHASAVVVVVRAHVRPPLDRRTHAALARVARDRVVADGDARVQRQLVGGDGARAVERERRHVRRDSQPRRLPLVRVNVAVGVVTVDCGGVNASGISGANGFSGGCDVIRGVGACFVDVRPRTPAHHVHPRDPRARRAHPARVGHLQDHVALAVDAGRRALHLPHDHQPVRVPSVELHQHQRATRQVDGRAARHQPAVLQVVQLPAPRAPRHEVLVGYGGAEQRRAAGTRRHQPHVGRHERHDHHLVVVGRAHRVLVVGRHL